jgi:hypothetical protein
MGFIENFPVSDMAKRKAEREVEEMMEIDDPVERLVTLIQAGNSLADISDGYVGAIEDLISPVFKHGLRVAVRTFIESGLPEDELPMEGLRSRMTMVSLMSSASLEAVFDGELADLYLPEDGGNG